MYSRGLVDVRWLADCSPAAIRAAVRVVAPDLARLPIVLPELVARDEPLWQAASASLGDEFFVKFAWSRPAALRIAHEIGVVAALAGDGVPFLPEVVGSGLDPVLMITRRVPGESLFQVVATIDRDVIGRQVARFLAALHRPKTLARVETAIGPLPEAYAGPQHPPPPHVLRERIGRWIHPDQLGTVDRWCDWAARVLADRRERVLAHSDFHGDNQVWEGGELRLVVDFETVSAAEPEYDLRTLPGTDPGVELLRATMRHYEQFTGRDVDIERVMAWHLLTALGDVLWRSEAGIALADRRSPADWVSDLAARLEAFEIDA